MGVAGAPYRHAVAERIPGRLDGCALLHDVIGSKVVLYHEDGQVPYYLGGRSYLYDIAQHTVNGLVHVLDLVKSVAQSKGFNLSLKVGILSSGDLILVDLSRSRLQFGFEFFVYRTYVSPVFGDLLKSVGIKSGVSVGVLKSRYDGVKSRL